MIKLSCEISLGINTNLINEITNDLNIDRDIDLNICNNETIQKFNKEYKNKDKATDVLSFPFIDINNEPLGCIVISYEYIKEKSKEFNHSIQDEFNLLFIHGLLHLLGFDHENDNGEMRAKEEEIINKYKLPKSLIIRT